MTADGSGQRGGRPTRSSLSGLLFDDPRRPAFLLGLAGAGALASAFTFQALGYDPCQLCVWQRWPYAVVLGLAVASWPLAGARRALVVVLVAMAIALAFNSGLALYHTGVEQHWWSNAFDCAAPATVATSVADLRARLMATDYVPCDKIPWELFGISIAGFNIAASAVLAAAAGVAAFVVGRGRA